MRRSGWWSVGPGLCGAVGCVAVGCSSPPSPPPPSSVEGLAAPGLTCDVDRSSEEAKNTNERVGGLRTATYVVRFAQTTRLGVVALVEGDLQEAYDELTAGYGVALVAELDEHPDRSAQTSTIAGFAQVRAMVEAECGTDEPSRPSR